VVESHALSNLDFEYELAGLTFPAHRAQRWRHILRLLPEARGASCLDPAHATGRIDGRLVAWGVTPRVVQLAPLQEFPSPEVVTSVNDKRFSHALEKRLSVALPYARLVVSLAELEQAVRECPHDWVLKHPFGVSARERAVGKRGQISESARGWARKQLARWSLLFEPWVHPRCDFSLHFHIARDGTINFGGHCQLVPDPGGVYRGNQVLPQEPVPPGALACGQRVARELARCGYWGPVGIDGFQGLLGDEPVFRPLVEINARYSFGRLTLALRDRLPDGWCLLWSHPKHLEVAYPPLPVNPGPGAYGLPLEADPQSTSGTVLYVAPTPDEVSQMASAR
jgi:hypothetical protein